MISGVSLKASDVVSVLLRREGKAHRPISLGVKGSYDRLGSIDAVHEGENTQAIMEFFTPALATGRFVVEAEYLRIHEAYPFENMEQLFRAFERNINDHSRAAVLDGEPVTFALIERTIWNVIAPREQNPNEPVTGYFRRLFKRSNVANAIYAGRFDKPALSGRLTTIESDLAELYRVQKFLTKHAIPWAHDDEPGQHYSEDMREYLLAARQRFRDVPLMLHALGQYEAAVEEFLKDEE